VVVAEIGARVVDWNRRYFAEATGHPLDDPRARVRVADLAQVLAESPGAFDLLLLDVDNGPGWLAAAGNARLYDRAGVATTLAALRPGGVLAVWSPCRNPTFWATLREQAPDAEEVSTAPWAGGEPPDVVYLARRP